MKHRHFVPAALALALFVTGPASADDETTNQADTGDHAEHEHSELDKMTVTAVPLGHSPSDLPVPVSIVAGDELFQLPADLTATIQAPLLGFRSTVALSENTGVALLFSSFTSVKFVRFGNPDGRLFFGTTSDTVIPNASCRNSIAAGASSYRRVGQIVVRLSVPTSKAGGSNQQGPHPQGGEQ